MATQRMTGPKKNPKGKELLQASLALVRQDRSIVLLPVVATGGFVVSLALVTGVFAGIGALVAQGAESWFVIIGLIFGLFLASFVTITCSVAVVFAATERMEGGDPTVGSSLRKAWTRRRAILGWVLLSTAVGTVLGIIQDKVPAGWLVSLLGEAAWQVATWLALPVIAYEGLGPIATVKRSSVVLTQQFGSVARGMVRFGILFAGWFFLSLALIVGGVLLLAKTPIPALGALSVFVGVVVLLAVSIYLSVVNLYLRTVIFRFATGRPTPDLGVDLASVL